MSKHICKRCKSINGVEDGCYGGTTYYRCDSCHHLGEKDEFPEYTLFDRITTSPEVLAENLVYEIRSTDPVFGGTYYWWCSTIIPGEKWAKREEAFSATVEELKEVAK